MTNGDYWRGYVGVAAAIWTETSVCKSVEATKEHIETDQWTGELIDYAYYGLTVVPVVTSYSYMNGKYYVHIDFFILGSMKTNFSRTIGKTKFYFGYLPDDCRVKVDSFESKNGYKYDKPTMGIDWGAAAKWGLKAFIFFAGFYASGGAALVLKGISGAMLFSDFLCLNPTITDVTNGVDELEPPNDYVDFEFDPPENYEVGGSYTYGEFESIIRVKLEVNMTNRNQWTVIPVQWRVKMMDSGGQSIVAEGDVSLAVFKVFDYKSYYRATVFFEDFSKEVNKWRIEDMNPSAGCDYWGITKPPGGGPGCQVYCAARGNNSIDGEPNDEIYQYDRGMDAYMSMQVDFRPYRAVTLRYYLFYIIASGDYLAVEYYQNGDWHTVETLSGSNPFDYWEETPIPTTAEKIRFRFYSNEDEDVDWGVFIHHIEIVAELPNDTNTNSDAGDSFDSAAYVTHPSSYGGYLNYDEDWYKFYVSSQDITEEKQIYISVSTPQYTYFKLELYYPNNTCAKSSAGTLTYTLSASDPTGWWRIRIYPARGFGQYGFRIELRTSSEGRGGCPILLVWNGNYYIDYGVINIHNSDGYDVIQEIFVLKEDLGIEGYIAKFKLREGWEGLKYSHSSIDQVKLYAVDKRGNRYLCPLIKAIHSEQGNIRPKILLSDDQKSDLYLSETIILKFVVPYPMKTMKSFTVVIEGCNLEKYW